MNHEFDHLGESEDNIQANFECLRNKKLLLISDFDETLAHQYIFSKRWDTHVPIIESRIVKAVNALRFPFCIATARGALEPVSWIISHKLLSPSIPLVVENGAALMWIGKSLQDRPRIELLLSDKELHAITRITNALPLWLKTSATLPNGHTLSTRAGRIASIELRAEEATSHRGTPEDYIFLSEQLRKHFPEIGELLQISFSGSSLSIGPLTCDKQSGIMAAIQEAHIDISDSLPIAIGDNQNDSALFAFARANGGLAIGVRSTVPNNSCDLILDGGSESSLRIINELITITV